jgi:hypothetical protein
MVPITDPTQHLDDLASKLRAMAPRLMSKGVMVSGVMVSDPQKSRPPIALPLYILHELQLYKLRELCDEVM